MDTDGQELHALQEQFWIDVLASQEEYHKSIKRAFILCTDLIQGASEERKQCLWQEYQQKKEALTSTYMERIRERRATHAQHINALEGRLAKMPNDIISPWWRLRVLRVAQGAPSYVQHSFMKRMSEAYSGEALREFLRFFLTLPAETEQGSPIELEVIRVIHEDSVLFLKGRNVTDRAVYHLDFRLPGQRDLIGHTHVQNEVIGAWVRVGGRFVHRATDYDDQGRPIQHKDRIHRPIPNDSIE